MQIGEIIKQATPLAAGFCASSVAEKLITTHIPEQEKLLGKLMQKIGVMAIGATVSAIVGKHVETEVNELCDILQPLGVLFTSNTNQTTINVENVEEELNGRSTEA